RGITQSLEFRTNEINDLYNKLLHRIPDPGGFNNALGILQHSSKEVLESFIIGSPEFFQIHGSSNDGFLTGVYSDLLSNSLSKDVRAAWDGVFQLGFSPAFVGQLIATGNGNLV